jgi:hypothetical protein
MGLHPQVMHIHEWQTCAVALLYWEIYHNLGMEQPRVVLTMHNMDSTGGRRARGIGHALSCALLQMWAMLPELQQHRCWAVLHSSCV